MIPTQWWMATVIALFIVLPIEAKAVVVANDFTAVFKNVSNENAFDFQVSVSGTVRRSNANPKVNPVSNVFTNFTVFPVTIDCCISNAMISAKKEGDPSR